MNQETASGLWQDKYQERLEYYEDLGFPDSECRKYAEKDVINQYLDKTTCKQESINK
jgi:hypothetical protein